MDAINLNVLTDDGVLSTSCVRYWEITDQGEFVYTVSTIASELGVPANKASKIIGEACQAFSSTIKCRGCGQEYVYTNRSDYLNRNRSSTSYPWTCQKCLQKQQQIRQEQQQIQVQKMRSLVREQLNPNKLFIVHPDSLSLYDAVYYLSVIRSGSSEDFSFINPINNFTAKLSPSHDFDKDILLHLRNRKLISIHHESDIDAFFINSDTNEVHFYPEKVKWIPLVAYERGRVREAIELLELVFQQGLWTHSWKEDFQILGRKIAIQECGEYLKYCLDEHHLPFKVGEKTIMALDLALDYFSVAQIYNFIWSAARNAAAFYQRQKGNVTSQHAANTVVRRIQDSVERSRDEQWEVKPFGRSYALPRTMISQVFFSTALHISDGGFTTPPNKWTYPELQPIRGSSSLPKFIDEGNSLIETDNGIKTLTNRSNHIEQSRRAKKRKKRRH